MTFMVHLCMLAAIHLAGFGGSFFRGLIRRHLVRLVVIHSCMLIMCLFTGLGMIHFSMFIMVSPSVLIVCHRGRFAALVLLFGCCRWTVQQQCAEKPHGQIPALPNLAILMNSREQENVNKTQGLLPVDHRAITSQPRHPS